MGRRGRETDGGRGRKRGREGRRMNEKRWKDVRKKEVESEEVEGGGTNEEIWERKKRREGKR